MKTRKNRKAKAKNHSGSTFDSFLEQEGIREEVEAVANKHLLHERYRHFDYACVHVFQRMAEVKPALPKNELGRFNGFENSIACRKCAEMPVGAVVDGPTDTMDGWARVLKGKELEAAERYQAKLDRTLVKRLQKTTEEVLG